MVSFDIDGIETVEQAQAERDRLFKEIPYVLSSSLSASGKGVWLLVTLSRQPVGREEFANIWWMLAVELQEKYNVTIGGTDGKGSTDTAPSNMVSLRFYTYDPDVKVRDATRVYELPETFRIRKTLKSRLVLFNHRSNHHLDRSKRCRLLIKAQRARLVLGDDECPFVAHKHKDADRFLTTVPLDVRTRQGIHP